jgi:Co/Zn/Cd efflux system component
MMDITSTFIANATATFFVPFCSVRLIVDFLHPDESTPRHVDINELVEAVNSIRGVESIHDIHLCSVCYNVHTLSAHILVGEMQVCETIALIDAINKVMVKKFNIIQTIFQLESIECGRFLIHGVEH